VTTRVPRHVMTRDPRTDERRQRLTVPIPQRAPRSRRRGSASLQRPAVARRTPRSHAAGQLLPERGQLLVAGQGATVGGGSLATTGVARLLGGGAATAAGATTGGGLGLGGHGLG